MGLCSTGGVAIDVSVPVELAVLVARGCVTQWCRPRCPADYDRNGFNVGSPPFAGDYFLAGASLFVQLSRFRVCCNPASLLCL